MQYIDSFDNLVAQLQQLPLSTVQDVHFESRKLKDVEKYYLSLKAKADKKSVALMDQTIKPYLAQTKLYLYWYNNMVQTKPYSFVAKIMGHSPI